MVKLMDSRRLESKEFGWADDAACKNADTSMFFSEGVAVQQAREQFCNRCPVSAECLVYSSLSRTKYGVWGGLSRKERYELFNRFGWPTACEWCGKKFLASKAIVRACSEQCNKFLILNAE